jgi:hypothetical protein
MLPAKHLNQPSNSVGTGGAEARQAPTH